MSFQSGQVRRLKANPSAIAPPSASTAASARRFFKMKASSCLVTMVLSPEVGINGWKVMASTAQQYRSTLQPRLDSLPVDRNPEPAKSWHKPLFRQPEERRPGVVHCNADLVVGLEAEKAEVRVSGFYSDRKASCGASRAALRAGSTPAARPITTATSSASTA